MTLERSVRISVLTQVGAGLAALSLALGSTIWVAVGLGGFVVQVAVSVVRPPWRPPGAVTSAMAIAIASSMLAEVVATGALLEPGAHFLILFQLLALSLEPSQRSYGLLCILSLTAMMLAGMLSVDLSFGLCFLLYLPAGVVSLMLLNLRGELERNGLLDLSQPVQVTRRPLVRGASAALAALVLTIVVFLYFPRFGLQLFQIEPAQRGTALIGFGDRVHLGDLEAILDNPEVVMSARLFRGDQPTEGKDLALRWRGTALDTYENGTWYTQRYIRELSDHSLRFPGFRSFTSQFPGEDVVQQIALEPGTTRVLFYLPRLMELRSGTPNLEWVFWHQPSRTVSAGSGQGMSLRYIARSRVPAWSAAELNRPGRPGGRIPPELPRCLQVPEPLLPRLRELAERIVAGIPREAPYDRAKAVERYLRDRFEYSTHSGPSPAGADPVEEFLFRRRSGHCEHFAAAMALLLRSVGIPARVVTGFSGGEWNEYGSFYVVRQRHAHAWVEAYMPGVRDWETFNPTPLAEAPPPPATGWFAALDRRLAHLRLGWNTYVVNYSTEDQREMVNALSNLLARLSVVVPFWGRGRLSLAIGRVSGFELVVLLLAVALVLGIAAFVGWRVIRRLRGWLGQGRAAARPRVGFYRKLEAILRRHGFRRDPGVTPLEFVRGVIASAGERYAPAATVAEAFCRVRYGARHLSPPERAAVARALAALERARRQIRISHQPSKSRRDGRTWPAA
jgi:transglutaminase-like putative cysteine protease